MSSSLALSLVQAAVNSGPGAPSPYLIGAIALVILMTLLLVTVAFRNSRMRNRNLPHDPRHDH